MLVRPSRSRSSVAVSLVGRWISGSAHARYHAAARSGREREHYAPHSTRRRYHTLTLTGIIGDARKRPEFKNAPLKFSADQVLSVQGATTVDALRALYEAPIDEFFGSIEPIMSKTNAMGTVQGYDHLLLQHV
jgi:hypothetical protein